MDRTITDQNISVPNLTMGGNGLGTKRPRFWRPLDGNIDEKPCYCLRLTLFRAAFSSGFTLVCLDVNTFG